MICKHNWIEMEQRGTYPFRPEVTKRFVYLCTRCQQNRVAELLTKEKTNG